MDEQQDYTVKQQKICYINAQLCESRIPNQRREEASLYRARRPRHLLQVGYIGRVRRSRRHGHDRGKL